MENKLEHSQEERLLAAIAHASVIASGIGIVVGVVIYLTEKDKSVWAAGQGLQAALYQIAGLVVIALSWVVWMVFYFIIIFALVESDTGSEDPPPAFWFAMATMCCPMLISVAWILYGFYGAIRTWMGNDFRYFLIGRLVDGFIIPTAK
jgi:uncharacterized Tic20 family protein